MLEESSFKTFKGNPICDDCLNKIDKLSSTSSSNIEKPSPSLSSSDKPTCHKCKKTLYKKYISALGKIWHRYCFDCSVCGMMLEPGEAFERNDEAFCEKCYDKTEKRKKRSDYSEFENNDKLLDNMSLNEEEDCGGGCGRKIKLSRKKHIKAEGKYYHTFCFTCTVCGGMLTEDEYKVREGKFYCQNDYNKKFNKKCVKCNKYITDYVPIKDESGNYYHHDCFVCSMCNDKLPDGFYEKDGNLLCTKCYKENYGPKCFVCHKPFGKECLIVKEKRYHPECHNCAICSKNLAGKTFVVKNNQNVCKQCV